MSGPKSAYFGISEKQYSLLCCALKNEEKFKAEEKVHAKLKQELSSFCAELSALESTPLSENSKHRLEKLKSRVAGIKLSDISGTSRFSSDEITAERKHAEQTLDLFRAELEGLRADVADSAKEKKHRAVVSLNTDDDDRRRLISELEKLEKKIPSQSIKDEIQTAVDSLNKIFQSEFLHNYIAITVLPLKKSCEAYLHLLSEYEAVLELLNEKPSEAELCETIFELENRLETARNTLGERRKQEYISQSIDEAMAEMGYKLVGDRHVVKNSGRSFKSELFSLDEKTAVSVTSSSDGQITMEIGGLDNVDRPPSNAESKSLADDMKGFCSDYERLLIALGERGVYISKMVSRLPPDEKYAQIFNLDDYCLEEFQNESNRSNTTDGLKYLRYGDE